MPSHAFLFFTAVLTDPAGHRRRVGHFPMTNEGQCLVSAVGSNWCILVVPLLRRGTGLLLSTFPPSFDNGIVISITVLMASGFPNKQQILASKHYVGIVIEGEERVSGQDVRGQNSCTITNVHAFSKETMTQQGPKKETNI
ncbi:hypothetical protein ES332_A05G079400v1 [Gossypium tomentosum]|uniref:Uncharacterized protein n=1 Tax=Gossypium tomentosum TaxID=34277 RepID=A0A5D2QC35_GOSTO|nr:hypothetical protein ES332_A05G079400v1 [Gossypium tomentosum]